MNYRQRSYLIVVIALLFLVSCAGNEQLVADKQTEIDSLTTLNSKLHRQLQGQGALQQELDKLRQAEGKQDAELRDALAKLANIKDVEVQENRTLITNDLLFQSGSFKITDGGKQILDEVWSVLEDHPNREILIVGHTDDLPIAQNFIEAYRSNWDLSTWRALAVLHYIKDLSSAHPERLAVVGYGPYRPVVVNNTDEARRKNRRVEIVLGEEIITHSE